MKHDVSLHLCCSDRFTGDSFPYYEPRRQHRPSFQVSHTFEPVLPPIVSQHDCGNLEESPQSNITALQRRREKFIIEKKDIINFARAHYKNLNETLKIAPWNGRYASYRNRD
jgi:hypothetical protein